VRHGDRPGVDPAQAIEASRRHRDALLGIAPRSHRASGATRDAVRKAAATEPREHPEGFGRWCRGIPRRRGKIDWLGGRAWRATTARSFASVGMDGGEIAALRQGGRDLSCSAQLRPR